ncbi:uncharacterized protein KZ484_006475 isoform 1-T3 [Pholidichthys leucotaenia]
MDQIEERLTEEVRRYKHLYDSSSPHYKDYQMAANSWKEISLNLGLDVPECVKKWKNVRDKYVRFRKRLATKNVDPGSRRVPAFSGYLSWLAPHVKHRDLEASCDDNKDGNESSASSSSHTCARSSVKATSKKAAAVEKNGPSLAPSNTMEEQPCPVTKKRRRKTEDDWVMRQVAELEERRLELQQKLQRDKDNDDDDECSRFGRTVADMLRRLPEQKRAQAMFDVHRVIFERTMEK